jgi:hypothetical protein
MYHDMIYLGSETHPLIHRLSNYFFFLQIDNSLFYHGNVFLSTLTLPTGSTTTLGPAPTGRGS